MIENRNILCIANPLYEGEYAKTIVELMNIFAQKNRVLYVENPFSFLTIIKGLLGFYHEKTPTLRLLGFSPRLRELPIDEYTNIHVLTPFPIIPMKKIRIHWLHQFSHRINSAILLRGIKKALQKLEMTENLIEINAFQPGFGVALHGKLNAKSTIYHCYDGINASTWLNVHGGEQEKKYIPIVDAVITTSQGLFEKKKANAKRTFLVPNAVNFDLFNLGFTQQIPNSKIIGYVGNLDS